MQKKNEDLLTIELWECNIDLNSDYVQRLFPFAENPRLQKAINIVSFFKMYVVVRLHLRLRRRLRLSFIVLCGTVHTNGAIHQAARRQNGLWRAFWPPVSHSQPMDIFPFH